MFKMFLVLLNERIKQIKSTPLISDIRGRGSTSVSKKN